MKRNIVKIDEVKCDGCGNCIPNCAEGALQIIDGKARLLSDLFCDGLGACLGHCPQGAITIEQRDAEAYDEKKVMDYIVKGGRNVIIAHLSHLKDHQEMTYLAQAFEYLSAAGIVVSPADLLEKTEVKSCPGTESIKIADKKDHMAEKPESVPTELRQWPVQLHLLNAQAEYFRGADLLLAADCTAFASGNFHQEFLKDKRLAIACPKLDSGKEIYIEKIEKMITLSEIKSITVLIMEVPCCRGLVRIASQAIENSGAEIPLRAIMLNIRGEVIYNEIL
ncbi:MAG: 4Fe-4S dicluster domain-containing protein [Methanococcaceae archaeon]